MSDTVAAAAPDDTGRRPPPERRRRRALVAAGAAILVAGVVAGLLVARSGPPAPAPRRARIAPGGASPAAPPAAIGRLLHRRAQALTHHDRHAFATTLDPERPGFRARQLAEFTDAAQVPFGSWSYRPDPVASGPVPAAVRRRAAGLPVLATTVVARYRIAGFDRTPVTESQHAVFVRRGTGWALTALWPVREPHTARPADIWDFSPVTVVRAPHVLVLGPATEHDTMEQAAQLAAAAIPRVSTAWGRPWARRVVIEVPATQREVGRLTGFTGDLSAIAALTSAEIRLSGRAKPAGDRVVLNPHTWPTISLTGRAIVLTHELTHVASRADTDAQTPRWLAEGLAVWVSFHRSGVPLTTGAAALGDRVRADGPPRRLPPNSAFDGGPHRLALAYDEAWLACATIVDHWGRARLMRFYRAVGTSGAAPGPAVHAALRQVLHTTRHAFLARWRAELRATFG